MCGGSLDGSTGDVGLSLTCKIIIELGCFGGVRQGKGGEQS